MKFFDVAKRISSKVAKTLGKAGGTVSESVRNTEKRMNEAEKAVDKAGRTLDRVGSTLERAGNVIERAGVSSSRTLSLKHVFKRSTIDEKNEGLPSEEELDEK
ncbi:MAG: hypothetical protein ACXAEU_00015 [Candidatus Hodarchaeales archaeon]